MNTGGDFTYLVVPTVSKVSPNPGPVRWRECGHRGLAPFPVGPLVLGEGGGRGARYFGPGYPSSGSNTIDLRTSLAMSGVNGSHTKSVLPAFRLG